MQQFNHDNLYFTVAIQTAIRNAHKKETLKELEAARLLCDLFDLSSAKELISAAINAYQYENASKALHEVV